MNEKINEHDIVTVTTIRMEERYEHKVESARGNNFYVGNDYVEFLKRYHERFLDMKVNSDKRSLVSKIMLTTTGR